MIFTKHYGYRNSLDSNVSTYQPVIGIPYPFTISGNEIDVSTMAARENTIQNASGYGVGSNSLQYIKCVNLFTPSDIYFYTTASGTERNRVYGYPLLSSGNGFAGSVPANCVRLDSAVISGRYKFRRQINWSGLWKELYEATVNVKCQINGRNVRAVIFCTNKAWSRTASNITSQPSELYIQTYNEYGNIKGQPADLFGDYSVDGVNLTEDYVNMIWDFGATPQEVPKPFVDWMNLNADAIYNYTYTVKNQNGTETLAQRVESPSLSSVNLVSVGTNKTLTLTGANGIDYVLTWESVTPSGKQFLGLAYDINSPRASIPNGQTTPVTIDGTTTWYEVYGTYRPPVTSFDINLYQSSAEVNRVDKTDFLTGVGTLSGVLREECSIIAPSITFKQTTVPTFNYVYIAAFGRYYYVTGITSVSKDVWRMSLSCDVLMTWKDDIRALTAIIARQENRFNPLLLDSELPAQANQNITVAEFPAGGFSTDSAIERPFLLTVVGA